MVEVDWTKPIEAVHTDRRVMPMTFMQVSRDGRRSWMTHESPADGSSNIHWHEDGADFCYKSGWRIRNVQPKTIPVDSNLWERCVGLVRDMAVSGVRLVSSSETREFYNRSIEIANLLPVEVDPDRTTSKEIAKDWGVSDNRNAVEAVLYALRCGRELERGGE